MSFFLSCPNDIIHYIISFLDLDSLLTLRVTCHKLYLFLSDQDYWQRKYITTYKKSPKDNLFNRILLLSPFHEYIRRATETSFVRGSHLFLTPQLCLERLILTNRNNPVSQGCYKDLRHLYFRQVFSKELDFNSTSTVDYRLSTIKIIIRWGYDEERAYLLQLVEQPTSIQYTNKICDQLITFFNIFAQALGQEDNSSFFTNSFLTLATNIRECQQRNIRITSRKYLDINEIKLYFLFGYLKYCREIGDITNIIQQLPFSIPQISSYDEDHRKEIVSKILTFCDKIGCIEISNFFRCLGFYRRMFHTIQVYDVWDQVMDKIPGKVSFRFSTVTSEQLKIVANVIDNNKDLRKPFFEYCVDVLRQKKGFNRELLNWLIEYYPTYGFSSHWQTWSDYYDILAFFLLRDLRKGINPMSKYKGDIKGEPFKTLSSLLSGRGKDNNRYQLYITPDVVEKVEKFLLGRCKTNVLQ